MRLLAFSDVHRDLDAAGRLVEMSREADVVAGVGDFASVHEGLEETIAALAEISVPALLVPGNNETGAALRDASAAWDSATVLHGEAASVAGVEFFGLGAGVPTTPWDWSFDLTDEQAAELLAELPSGGVLLTHSPPRGHADVSGSGDHLGSAAILAAVERAQPRLVLCGHIHESWGAESVAGTSRVRNLGPEGAIFELEP